MASDGRHDPDWLVSGFPWRRYNRFTLLKDGTQFYPDMLSAIAGARAHILFEMYLFESGQVATRFIDALLAARQRGVEVCILLDDFGSRGLVPRDRRRLAAGGVQLTLYNPIHYGKWRRNLYRDHRKLLIVDAHSAWLGGAGITDDFDAAAAGRRAWRETMVRVEGECVQDLWRLFAFVWRRWAPQALTSAEPALHSVEPGQMGRIGFSAPGAVQNVKQSLIKRLYAAEYRVWIATAYFVPSIKIRRQLAAAARRGVDVRLLLPGRHTDHPAVRHAGRRFYFSLLRHGVRIYEYQPRFTHSKVLLADSWAAVGSSNIDRWNLHWNLELSQEVEDQGFVSDVVDMFERDFSDSREMTLERWRQRPWYWRVLEYFLGRVDIWLARLRRGAPPR